MLLWKVFFKYLEKQLLFSTCNFRCWGIFDFLDIVALDVIKWSLREVSEIGSLIHICYLSDKCLEMDTRLKELLVHEIFIVIDLSRDLW